MPYDDFYERLMKQLILKFPPEIWQGFPIGSMGTATDTQAITRAIRIHTGNPEEYNLEVARLRRDEENLRYDLSEARWQADELCRQRTALEAELKGLYEICYALEKELKILKAATVIDQPMVVIRRHL
jgi:predicted RNase H-like nuclease (RuvC/YqgF family)